MSKPSKKATPAAPAEPKREPTPGERKGIEAAKAFCRERVEPLS